MDTNNANLDWKILSADQTFYYTFGSDGRYPFQNGWVTVTAETMKKANGLFRNFSHAGQKGSSIVLLYIQKRSGRTWIRNIIGTGTVVMENLNSQRRR